MCGSGCGHGDDAMAPEQPESSDQAGGRKGLGAGGRRQACARAAGTAIGSSLLGRVALDPHAPEPLTSVLQSGPHCGLTSLPGSTSADQDRAKRDRGVEGGGGRAGFGTR